MVVTLRSVCEMRRKLLTDILERYWCVLLRHHWREALDVATSLIDSDTISLIDAGTPEINVHINY